MYTWPVLPSSVEEIKLFILSGTLFYAGETICFASAATTGLNPTGTIGTNSCPAGLPAPLNGAVTYSIGFLPPYPSGTIATVVCNLGFSSSGPASSTCQNGIWSPATTAQCVPGKIGTPYKSK